MGSEGSPGGGDATRSALERLLEQRRAEARGISRADRSQPLRLSPFQESYWIEYQIDRESRRSNLGCRIRLDGPVDLEACQATLRQVVARHEILRTVFRDVGGQAAQVVQSNPVFGWTTRDLGGRPLDALAADYDRFVADRFDLEVGPPFRATLVSHDGATELWMVAHHIVFDAASYPILMREIEVLYAAILESRPPGLEPLPLQLADCAATQLQRLELVREKELAFWNHFLGPMPRTELRLDRPRPRGRGHNGLRYRFEVPPKCSAQVAALSQQLAATPFVISICVFLSLLSRSTGQRDLLVGVPVNMRTIPGSRKLIGTFANLLPFRSLISAGETFEGFVARTQASALDMFANADLSFSQLACGLESPNLTTPRLMFTLDPATSLELTLGSTRASFPWQDRRAPRFDLALRLRDADGALHGMIEYDGDLFLPATIERLGAQFVTLLDTLTADPTQRAAPAI